MPNLSFKVEGLDELVKKLNGNALLAKPVRDAFSKAGLFLESEAKVLTPVDTGRLRSSITHEVDSSTIPLFGKVGTNVEYAPYVEDDTKPHMPPVSALETWAGRHGIDPWALAMKIRREGTKGAHMFKNALEKGQSQVQGFFDEAALAIQAAWGK